MKYELFPINKVEVSVGAGDAIAPTIFKVNYKNTNEPSSLNSFHMNTKVL